MDARGSKANLDMELQFYYREDLQIGHRENQLYVDIRHTPSEPPAYAIVRTIDPFFHKAIRDAWDCLLQFLFCCGNCK